MDKELSGSSVPHGEPQVGPSSFAYHFHEIKELFSQKEDLFPPASKNSVLFPKTSATVNDDDIHLKSEQVVGPSVSRTLFLNGVGDGFPDIKKGKLQTCLKQSVTVFSQEVDEMLESVLEMCKIKKHLINKELLANDPSSAAGVIQSSPSKKQKLSSSPSSSGDTTHVGTKGSQSRDRASSFGDIGSSEESQSRGLTKICLNCKTTRTPQWRDGPDGPKTLCNACGIRLKKKRMSPLGANEANKKLKQEDDDDLRIILESSGSLAKEAVKKYSDEMFGKLGDMEQQLEKCLDVIMSKCRKMAHPEKQQLRKLIQNLPPKNLDRVVDIIVKHRKSSEGPCSEIHINLENEDNGTLWRLYYYVEAVARASNLS
ncbi:hypothetical protein AQUCO_01100414v1 [Aquilegia coerulea]|uniref:GATA-type domain-containing protein n=1 Tax=Aquilegia coerulea TaxID=218851 RepID=A0A2G5E721_AQUCA|nr:hypothetical protein AQUCO_01100414v1 [Aquilegia coerulea]